MLQCFFAVKEYPTDQNSTKPLCQNRNIYVAKEKVFLDLQILQLIGHPQRSKSLTLLSTGRWHRGSVSFKRQRLKSAGGWKWKVEFFTAQCTLVQMRGLGIACRPSVRPSVCNVGDL